MILAGRKACSNLRYCLWKSYRWILVFTRREACVCVCVYIILESGSILFNKIRLCISMNINFLFSIAKQRACQVSELRVSIWLHISFFFSFSFLFDAIQCNSIPKYMYFVHIWKPQNDIYGYWYCLQLSISFVKLSIENCIFYFE